jgi:hypothetical protein
MIKKLVAIIFIISSLSAGTVGANKDGKVYDKIFLDIFLDNGEVNYQYLPYTGNSFNMQDRNLHKAFYEYEARKLKKAKVTAIGKLEVPNNIKDKFLFIAHGYTHGKVMVDENSVWGSCRENDFYKRYTKNGYNNMESRYGNLCGYGWQLYINGTPITKERTMVLAKKDSMGNRFLDIKIEGRAYNVKSLQKYRNYIDKIRLGISNINFYAEVNNQSSRGSNSTKQKVYFRPYVVEK